MSLLHGLFPGRRRSISFEDKGDLHVNFTADVLVRTLGMRSFTKDVEMNLYQRYDGLWRLQAQGTSRGTLPLDWYGDLALSDVRLLARRHELNLTSGLADEFYGSYRTTVAISPKDTESLLVKLDEWEEKGRLLRIGA